MEEAAATGVTINKAKHRHFVSVAATRVARACLPADVSLVNLHRASTRAERRKVAFAHGFADAMGKKPRRLIGDLQHTMQLVGRDTLLAARHEVDGLKH